MPFSGLAQGFLRQGVPAVVAMQASITDDAALIFTRYFYRDLIETGTVDASLTEARLRMQGNGHPIEWGTPVLYMRALSGQLFKPGANLDERTTPKDVPVKETILPRPVPTPHERSKRQREVPARDGPTEPKPRLEPGPTERKRQKEVPKKENPPPLHPPPPLVERKKTRESRAEEPAPSLKAEPKLDTWTPAQPIRPDPRLDIPEAPEVVPPKPTAPVPPPLEPKSRLVDMLVRYWPAAGLAAFSLVVAGVYIAGRDHPAPAPAKPSAILVPSSSPPAPTPSAPPQPQPQPPAPVTTLKRVEDHPPAKEPEIHARSPVVRKAIAQQTARKRTAPAATDNCNDPDVSARQIDCLLKK
jgi:hypothetical protein